jgi:TRAP-type C4-dicarboxylate transport system permease small subunit
VRGATALRIIKELIVIVALAMMVYGGMILANPDRPSVSAALGIPMWMIYAVIPVSGMLSIIFLVIRMVRYGPNEQGKE